MIASLYPLSFLHYIDPSCVLLPPKSKSRPAPNLVARIAPALATRFDVTVKVVNRHLRKATIEEWGKIRCVDSDAGDTITAFSMSTDRDDMRDTTYVRVRDFTTQIPICHLFICCNTV